LKLNNFSDLINFQFVGNIKKHGEKTFKLFRGLAF